MFLIWLERREVTDILPSPLGERAFGVEDHPNPGPRYARLSPPPLKGEKSKGCLRWSGASLNPGLDWIEGRR